ncbi:MAG: hypothetical protein FWD80_03180, partial [Propionibacteriaceae bacterium]|nr:hypothetical protein [Propionibacteriaceae bacterium]
MAGRRTHERRRQRDGAAAERVVWSRLLPWPVAAVVGAMATAAAGWLICAAFCLVGWLSAISEPLTGPVRLAVGLFLLANGASVNLGGVDVSIIPLLLTFGIVACGVGLTR